LVYFAADISAGPANKLQKFAVDTLG